MAVKKGGKVFKLPRHLIARMCDDNPQAIQALENLEIDVVQTLPEQIEQLAMSVERVDNEIVGAVALALNALAVANQAKANNGYLGAVAVVDVPCPVLNLVVL